MDFSGTDGIKEQFKSFILGKIKSSNEEIINRTGTQRSSAELGNDDSQNVLEQIQSFIDDQDPDEAVNFKEWKVFNSKNELVQDCFKADFSIKYPPDFRVTSLYCGLTYVELSFKPKDLPYSLDWTLKIMILKMTFNFKNTDGSYNRNKINTYFLDVATRTQDVVSSLGPYYDPYPIYDMEIFSVDSSKPSHSGLYNKIRKILASDEILITLQCSRNIVYQSPGTATYHFPESKDWFLDTPEYEDWVSDYCYPFFESLRTLNIN
jgi:hypothetical protein